MSTFPPARIEMPRSRVPITMSLHSPAPKSTSIMNCKSALTVHVHLKRTLACTDVHEYHLGSASVCDSRLFEQQLLLLHFLFLERHGSGSSFITSLVLVLVRHVTTLKPPTHDVTTARGSFSRETCTWLMIAEYSMKRESLCRMSTGVVVAARLKAVMSCEIGCGLATTSSPSSSASSASPGSRMPYTRDITMTQHDVIDRVVMTTHCDILDEHRVSSFRRCDPQIPIRLHEQVDGAMSATRHCDVSNVDLAKYM